MREYSYKLIVLKSFFLFLFTSLFLIMAVYSEIKSNSIGALVGTFFSGALVPYFFSSLPELTDNENWKTSQRKLKKAGLLHKDSIVRISFAYLFRIKVDGKYFLIKSNRTKKYQPVGGVYKFTKDEATYLGDNIPVENDNRIPVNEITKRDYRLRVKNKDLRKFVKRFNKTKNRENVSDLSREFIEEMFSSNILNKKSFGNLSYKYVGRHMTDVEYTSVFSIYELLLADIIEVQLTDEQENLYRDLMENRTSEYYFADADEIKSHGVMHGTDKYVDHIANHTPKILTEGTDKLMFRNKNKEIVTIKL